MAERQRRLSVSQIVEAHIALVENGEQTLIRRIQETLDLDSQTRPSREQIELFVKSKVIKKTKDGRKRN